MARPRISPHHLPLLPRMQARPWTDGKTFTYRYLPKDGQPVNLGTDHAEACERVKGMQGALPPLDALDSALLAKTLKRHEKGAKQRNIPFCLTAPELHGIVERQGSRCAITGLPFRDGKPAGLRARPWLPSIDRIDSKRGYAAGNVRVVCSFVNVAMNGFGETMFRQVLEALIEKAVEERLNFHGYKNDGNSVAIRYETTKDVST